MCRQYLHRLLRSSQYFLPTLSVRPSRLLLHIVLHCCLLDACDHPMTRRRQVSCCNRAVVLSHSSSPTAERNSTSCCHCGQAVSLGTTTLRSSLALIILIIQFPRRATFPKVYQEPILMGLQFGQRDTSTCHRPTKVFSCIYRFILIK